MISRETLLRLLLPLAGGPPGDELELASYYGRRPAPVGFTPPEVFTKLMAMGGAVRGLLLDLGCGIGRLVAWLPPEATYLGIDLLEAHIGQARRVWPQHCFAVGDARLLSGIKADTVVLCRPVSPGVSLADFRMMIWSAKRCAISDVRCATNIYEQEVRQEFSIREDAHRHAFFSWRPEDGP